MMWLLYISCACLIISLSIIIIITSIIPSIIRARAGKRYYKTGKCNHEVFTFVPSGSYKWCRLCINKIYVTPSEIEKIEKDLAFKNLILKSLSNLCYVSGIILILNGLFILIDSHPILQVIIGLIIISVVILIISNRRNANKLAEAQRQYQEKRICGHHTSDKWTFYTLGQTGVPGVITMTNKWCKVCGDLIGPAKLVNGRWV